MLNVEKVRADKIYGNDKAPARHRRARRGLGEDFDVNKLRYHKGHHHGGCRCGRLPHPHPSADLLLPLYAPPHRKRLRLRRRAAAVQARARQDDAPAFSEEERDKYSAELRGDNPNAKVDISRFKGLGEMDAHELWGDHHGPRKAHPAPHHARGRHPRRRDLHRPHGRKRSSRARSSSRRTRSTPSILTSERRTSSKWLTKTQITSPEDIRFPEQKIVTSEIVHEMTTSNRGTPCSSSSAALCPTCATLKPVHRRILYAMYEDGLTNDKPFKKIRHLRRRRARPLPSPRRRVGLRRPCPSRRTSPCAICKSTATATSARSMATPGGLPLHRGAYVQARQRDAARH